jgi:hypothetical protein
MNYTIACTEELHTGFSVEIDNRKRVTIMQKREDQESLFKGKDYETADEARAAYMRIVKCILASTYSFEVRAAML